MTFVVWRGRQTVAHRAAGRGTTARGRGRSVMRMAKGV